MNDLHLFMNYIYLCYIYTTLRLRVCEWVRLNIKGLGRGGGGSGENYSGGE